MSENRKKENASKKTEEKEKAVEQSRATQRAVKRKKETDETPKAPSVNQPLLDKYVRIITENIGNDCLEEAYINDKAKEVPTIVVACEQWGDVARFLKYNEQLSFDYVSDLHGVDLETHFDVYVHVYSYKEKHALAVKIKVDREKATIPSVTPVWNGANWPERETYDLLGIKFEGHPDLRRILLTDDWVGYPLRKDYEPHDEGV